MKVAKVTSLMTLTLICIAAANTAYYYLTGSSLSVESVLLSTMCLTWCKIKDSELTPAS